METTRSLTMLNGTGHIEVSWESSNDEEMRAIIEKKMKEGVRFFVMKTPVFGVARRVKLKSLGELEQRAINFDDPDLERMFVAGKIGVTKAQQGDALQGAEPALAKTPAQVVASPRSVAVRPLQGG